MEATFTTELVTPEMASQWLEKNYDKQRPVRVSHIDSLAEAMKRGEWKLNHQPIAFDAYGMLIDGQHRLWAVVMSGCSVQMAVARGVPRNTYATIDVGARRSLSDALGLDRKVVETVNKIARVVNHPSRITPTLISHYYKVFGPVASELLQGGRQNNSRGVSTAVVRAATVLRIMAGQDKQETFDVYHRMVLRDYVNLPPAVLAFIRQIDQRGTPSLDGDEGFVRAWSALDLSGKDRTRILVKDPEPEMAKIRALINRLISATAPSAVGPAVGRRAIQKRLQTMRRAESEPAQTVLPLAAQLPEFTAEAR